MGKQTFADTLREMSSERVQAQKIRDEAIRVVGRHVASAKELATANAQIGRREAVYEGWRPFVSRNAISESQLMEDICEALRAEGLKAKADVRECPRSNISKMFITMEW